MTTNWNRRKYTQQEFIDAWKSSLSIAEVARKLNLNKFGGTYLSLNQAAQDCSLDKSHMTGMGHNVGAKFKPVVAPTPLDNILVDNYNYSSHKLKQRLWIAGIFDRKCYRCGIVEWQGQPAPLALEHINGKHDDNRLENLTILCYNCHGLTSTYAGKNKGKQ